LNDTGMIHFKLSKNSLAETEEDHENLHSE